MIAAIVGGLALVTSDSGSRPTFALAPKAACRLATRMKIPEGAVYTIKGRYFADGMHGASLELPSCDVGLSPELDGAALAISQRYHSEFQTKCGSWLHGDYISGVFTGHFIRRRVRLYGMSAPSMINVFVITEVTTNDENLASIACGNQPPPETNVRNP